MAMQDVIPMPASPAMLFLLRSFAAVCGVMGLAALPGCSSAEPGISDRGIWITGKEVELIGIARAAAEVEGRPLKGHVAYTIHRQGDGWIVSREPWHIDDRTGERIPVFDATFSVSINSQGNVSEIRTDRGTITPSTQPR